MNDATQIIQDIERGEPGSAEQLLDLVYQELRRLAAFKLARETPGQTLQSTALVHEAWLKLMGGTPRSFNDRTHFFNAAAEAMRRILIDRARKRQTERHGGKHVRVEFESLDLAGTDSEDDGQLLALNEALEKLAETYPDRARVVKLRYFTGLSNEEIAETMNLSVSTVKNYWVFARAWLFDQIMRQKSGS